MAHAPFEITANFSNRSKDILFMPSSGNVTKVVTPGECVYLMSVIADPLAESFIKKCTVTHSFI